MGTAGPPCSPLPGKNRFGISGSTEETSVSVDPWWHTLSLPSLSTSFTGWGPDHPNPTIFGLTTPSGLVV